MLRHSLGAWDVLLLWFSLVTWAVAFILYDWALLPVGVHYYDLTASELGFLAVLPC